MGNYVLWPLPLLGLVVALRSPLAGGGSSVRLSLSPLSHPSHAGPWSLVLKPDLARVSLSVRRARARR